MELPKKLEIDELGIIRWKILDNCCRSNFSSPTLGKEIVRRYNAFEKLLEACKLSLAIDYTNDIEISPLAKKCQKLLERSIAEAEQNEVKYG